MDSLPGLEVGRLQSVILQLTLEWFNFKWMWKEVSRLSRAGHKLSPQPPHVFGMRCRILHICMWHVAMVPEIEGGVLVEYHPDTHLFIPVWLPVRRG